MTKKIILGIIGLFILIVAISLIASPKSKDSLEKGMGAGETTANQQSQNQDISRQNKKTLREKNKSYEGGKKR